MKKVAMVIVWVLFLTILLLGAIRLSGIISDLFNYQSIDPDGSFARNFVRHTIQGLIFVLIMIGINKIKPLNFGFGWGNKELGKVYVRNFAFYFFLYTAGAYLSTILTQSFVRSEFPLTATNILGQLGFQLFLSGPSEELIFRAFAITMLALFVKSRIIGGKVSVANILAALIFGMAHISFTFAPFEARYRLFQVIYAIVLGLFYGDCFEKTKSVYYPMMMHSISNIIMVGLAIILSFIM